MKRIVVLILVIAVMLPVTIGSWGLTESSEARYAEISREMFLRGDYLNPSLLNIHHYHKPPVTYYITALGYYIFGVNEYGARFFLAIAFLFQLFFVYKIAQLLYEDQSVALAAVLIYFSYPIAQMSAKNLTTDCYLATFIFAAVFAFLKYRASQNAPKYLYAFFICCGVAFLTKGPVGVLPQAIFAIAYSMRNRNGKRFSMHTLIAVLLFLVISFSWFLLLLSKHRNLLDYFVVHQLVDRVSNNSFGREKPFWYYLVFMPLAGLPVFYLFFSYLKDGLVKKRSGHPVNRILMISLFVSLLIFSLSKSKLIFYILPLYLFTSLLSARHLISASPGRQKVFQGIAWYSYTILFVALLSGCFIHTPLSIPLLPGILLSLAGIGLISIARFGNLVPFTLKAPVISGVGTGILIFTLPFLMKANELEINSVKPLIREVKSRKQDNGGSIIVYNYLLPSLSFYSGRELITIDNGNKTAVREVHLEMDTAEIKRFYIKVKTDSGNLREISLQRMYCIVARKEDPIPDSLIFLKQQLPDSMLAGKWIIYY